ncbi:MAG TPA: tetratricopeptide repeat protein [Casimicrobiaceae bacterium]|nr:tetratricopeptide repeat protein [Casimicrobiaceae bacterium]
MADGTSAASLGRARARLAAGDVAGAQRDAEAILRSDDARSASAAHLVLSACAKRRGDDAAQRLHVQSALALDPDSALAHFAAAEFQERDGAPAAAMASLEKAVALQPGFVAAHQQLGILRGEDGDAKGAAEAFMRVVTLDPRNPRGYNNLGNALRTLGRQEDARRAFERAVELKPDYELAIANLAVHWRDAGDIPRAEQLARTALARRAGKPPLRALVVLLAGLLRERGALDEAEPLYEQAIAMAPKASAGEWFNLGRVHAERDDLPRARDAYRRSFESDRTDLRGALGARLSLPMIYADAAELRAARDAYAEGLASLHADVESLVAGLSSDQVIDGLRWTNFFLAYQGHDDRELQARYAAFVARALEIGAPQWRALPAAGASSPAPSSSPGGPAVPQAPMRGPSARLRVGFASAFFHVGTAGRYFRSWITDLPRERFEVFVYHLRPGLDDIASEIKARADRFEEFGGSRARPSVVAPAIRDDALDVLVYPELGMDHTSFALAALRLAPRQLAGWGHPVTTGHATIDGFVSCGGMEPEGASAHYTEPLLTLPGVGTCYRSLALPDAGSRARFGLPERAPLLLCPQSLFKVHPDNDDLYAEVLAANPEAMLVMFDGRHPRVTGIFEQRMARALDARGVARQRLRILPPVPHDDYLRINLLCDVMLDTLHWSGGNTSLDALACGLPVVTLPGAFMRGRQSAAMLRIVGVPELVAADRSGYVELATRLLRDPQWRGALARRIRDGRGLLFDARAPVEAFANLLLCPAPSPACGRRLG